jgi:hypothetical protein
MDALLKKYLIEAGATARHLELIQSFAEKNGEEVGKATRDASCARDLNERRKIMGKLLTRVTKKLACFL